MQVPSKYYATFAILFRLTPVIVVGILFAYTILSSNPEQPLTAIDWWIVAGVTGFLATVGAASCVGYFLPYFWVKDIEPFHRVVALMDDGTIQLGKKKFATSDIQEVKSELYIAPAGIAAPAKSRRIILKKRNDGTRMMAYGAVFTFIFRNGAKEVLFLPLVNHDLIFFNALRLPDVLRSKGIRTNNLRVDDSFEMIEGPAMLQKTT